MATVIYIKMTGARTQSFVKPVLIDTQWCRRNKLDNLNKKKGDKQSVVLNITVYYPFKLE